MKQNVYSVPDHIKETADFLLTGVAWNSNYSDQSVEPSSADQGRESKYVPADPTS